MNTSRNTPANPERRTQRRRRVVMAGAIMLLLVSLQVYALATPVTEGAPRAVDIVRTVGFAGLALVLALRSTTAFSLFGRDARMDDELVQANRANAAKWGYLTLMLGALAILGVSLFAPLRAIDVLPMLLMLGAFVPAVRFVRLERRGEGDA